MRNVHTNFKHCLCDIMLRHSMLQLCSVVIVTYIFWVVVWDWVPGRWLISQGGEPLCVEVPVTLFRVYLGIVASFWSTFVLGGVM